jgi:hypothetical protein
MNTHTDKAAELDAYIKDIRRRCNLDSWTHFVNDVDVPGDLYPALASNRPELIKAIPPRQLEPEEAKALFNIIGTLIETNAALKEHAAHTAKMVLQWGDAFKHLRSLGYSIERFATFDHAEEVSEE